MLHSMKQLPVCSLPPSDMLERIARWKTLIGQTLTKTNEPGLVKSTYPRKAEILNELNELIALEAGCCSFLEFKVSEEGDRIEVELRYPKDFEGAVGALS